MDKELDQIRNRNPEVFDELLDLWNKVKPVEFSEFMGRRVLESVLGRMDRDRVPGDSKQR